MSSKENKVVLEHLRKLLVAFDSVSDERVVLQHCRYVADDVYRADRSIQPCCDATPVSADGIYSLWVAAKGADPNRRILYVHGGAFVVGSLRGHHSLASHLSKATGASVLLVDYRLAPEHKFPAPVEDIKKAFQWMQKNGPNGESPADKSYIAGDSAGGGLTLSTTAALRDEELPLPDKIVALSPWAELEQTSASSVDNSKLEPCLSKESLSEMADLYVNSEEEKNHPLASPLFASYKNFPPLLLQVGSREVLLDDSKRVAEKAKKEGVQVDLQVWEDLAHGFHGFAPFLPEANEALAAIGKFLSS